MSKPFRPAEDAIEWHTVDGVKFRVRPVFDEDGTFLRYEIRKRPIDGQRTPQIRKWINPGDDLEKELQELARRVKAIQANVERGVAATRDTITYGQYIRLYYLPYGLNGLKRRAPSTQRDNANYLDRVILPALDDVLLCEIGPQLLDEIVTGWEKQLFPWYHHRDRGQVGAARKNGTELPQPAEFRPLTENERRRAISVLKATFTYAEQMEWIASNPARHLLIPDEDDWDEDYGMKTTNMPVEPEIVERVIREFRRGRDRALVRVLYVGGPRPSEPIQWTWGLIYDFETCRFRDRFKLAWGTSAGRRWRPKNKKKRWFRLLPPAQRALAEWFAERTVELGRLPKPDELVFPNDDRSATRPYLNVHVWGYATFANACRRAGVESFNIYRLRATAVALLAAGGDASKPGRSWTHTEIARQLGHSVATLEKYYLDILEHPERYRGVPIEEAVADAEVAAEAAARASFAGIEALLRRARPADVVELLNLAGRRAPSGQPWTTGTLYRLLEDLEHEATLTALRERAEAVIEVLARNGEPDIRIAACLQHSGYRTSGGRRWDTRAVGRVRARQALTPTLDQSLQTAFRQAIGAARNSPDTEDACETLREQALR